MENLAADGDDSTDLLTKLEDASFAREEPSSLQAY